MSRDDCARIFTLLAQFFPHQTYTQTRIWREAWILGLTPYRYEAVRERVLLHAAKKHFFPDLADITARLSRITPEPSLPPEQFFCPLLRTHHGTVGEIMHRYVPQGCTTCEKRSRCHHYARIMQEKIQ